MRVIATKRTKHRKLLLSNRKLTRVPNASNGKPGLTEINQNGTRSSE